MLFSATKIPKIKKMISRRGVAAVVLLVVVAAAVEVRAQNDPDIDKFLKEFDAKRTFLNDYTAVFRQIKFNRLFNEYSEPATGTLTYKRPGRIVWRYEKPDEMTVLLRNRRVHMYIADMAQMDVYDFRDERSMKALFLGFDQTAADLKKSYDIDLVDPGDERSDTWAVKLKPHDKKLAAYFQRVNLWLRKKDFAVTKIAIEGPGGNGNLTEIRLTDIKTNKNVPDKTFDLEVPPETSIIEHTPDELKSPTIRDE